jgi:hypothetical protein
VTAVVIALAALVAVVASIGTALRGRHVVDSPRRRGRSKTPSGSASGTARILFPFTATGLSTSALDAALRLARAEAATLVPVLLAIVPRHLPITAPLTRQSGLALFLQDAIEQRAAAFGVPVDARIERGRTYRHSLRETISQERCGRVVVAAARIGEPGFSPDEIAWLMAHAPGEIVVLRAASTPCAFTHSLAGNTRTVDRISAP